MSQDVFAGILGGLGEAHQEHSKNLLTEELSRRKSLSDFWHSQAADQTLRPEARDLATQKYMTIIQTPYDKKLPKGIEGIDDFLTVSPKTGQSLEQPKAQPPQPPPTGTVASATGQGALVPPPVAPPFLTPSTLQSPEFKMPARFTDDELAAKAQRQGSVAADVAGQAAFAKQAGENRANDTPEHQASQAALKNAERGPFAGAAGSTVFIPDGKGGYSQVHVAAKPDDLSAAEMEQQIAFGSYAEKYKLDPAKLTATQRATALREFKKNLDTNGEPLYPVIEGNNIVYRPRTQAAGMSAPRTLYDNSGNPSAGGQSGMSTSPPPVIPAATQDQLTGWQLSIKQIDTKVLPGLEKSKETLGPFSGRVTLAEVEKLGGYGATPEQIRLAIQMRRLLMSQAFAEGGKQLTPTEKEEFIALNPSLTDTFDQAIIKAQEARDFLKERFQERLNMMPVRQSNQITGGTNAPKPPPGTGTIRMKGPKGEFNVPTDQQKVFEQNGYVLQK